MPASGQHDADLDGEPRRGVGGLGEDAARLEHVLPGLVDPVRLRQREGARAVHEGGGSVARSPIPRRRPSPARASISPRTAEPSSRQSSASWARHRAWTLGATCPARSTPSSSRARARRPSPRRWWAVPSRKRHRSARAPRPAPYRKPSAASRAICVSPSRASAALSVVMPEAIESGAPGSAGGHAARWARDRQWAARSPRVSVQHHAEVSASGALAATWSMVKASSQPWSVPRRPRVKRAGKLAHTSSAARRASPAATAWRTAASSSPAAADHSLARRWSRGTRSGSRRRSSRRSRSARRRW